MTTAGVWEVIVNYTMFESIDFSSTFIAVMLRIRNKRVFNATVAQLVWKETGSGCPY